MLAGTFFSHIGLAVTDFAKQKKVMFVAAEPLSDALTWAKGNHYTFRLRPNTTMQAAMLAEEAAKLGIKRWATIAPNYKYGQDAVAAFKAQLNDVDIAAVITYERNSFGNSVGDMVQPSAIKDAR